MIRDSKQVQIGKAGEYLVCADLILKGFVAFPSEAGLPYDVVLDNGKKMLRVQVKTTEGLRVIPQRNKESLAYIFNIKRAGSNGKTIYSLDEIDIFALVCLDTKRVGYVKNYDMPSTINIRSDELRGTYHDEQGIITCKSCVDLSSQGYSIAQIAKRLQIHVSAVSRYLHPDFEPFKTNARYFSDFEQKKEWFYEL